MWLVRSGRINSMGDEEPQKSYDSWNDVVKYMIASSLMGYPADLGVPTPPQSFRESLKDSFRDNGWDW